jgi:uncharacterized ion transporter superfamily protein YfcC
MSEAKRNFKMPHTFVILFAIIVLATLASYVVPAGTFDRVQSQSYSWLQVIVPGTFHAIEPTPVGPFKMFISIFEGLMAAASIIFFVFIAYSYVHLVAKTGAISGFSSALLNKTKGKEILVIPIFMIFFGICGSTFGMIESTYGLIPIFAGIAIAMGYDAIVGMSMVGLAAATGFASATTNPFTIGVAQSIAGLPLFSAIGFRIAVFVVFQVAAIWYTMRYAAKIKNDPTKSLLYGLKQENAYAVEDLSSFKFTGVHKLLLAGFAFTVTMLVIGGLKLKWGIPQMGALFMIMTLISGAVARKSPSEIAETILEACSSIVFGALVVGVARAILVVLTAGGITDTIINALAQPLTNLPTWATAQGMLIVQNIVNLFIPSGSGQAATTMPIMAPLADLIGITRQTAVVAFQFGDGYSNLLWPTCAVVVMCAVGKIPYEKWLKFFLPLYGIFFALQMVFITIAVAMKLGPF